MAEIKKDIDAIYEEAREAFMNIPNVIGVGFGYKEKDNKRTDELSIIVYVSEKKPLAELNPDERIPSEFRSVKTDVVVTFIDTPLECEDKNYYDPLVCGITISQELTNTGTLGCFATINGDTSRDNFVMLSNQHVLDGLKNDKIYQPLYTAGSFDETKTRTDGEIGKINNIGIRTNFAFRYPEDASDVAEGYYIDCATARVNTSISSCCGTNCGVKFKVEIKGAIPIAGVKRLIPSDIDGPNPYIVRKIGRRTGLTRGKVIVVNAAHGPQNDRKYNTILIEPLDNNCEGLRKFADHGDSGSVIINEQNEIIGLLYATPNVPAESQFFGLGLASHIHPVIKYLNITILQTPVAGGGGRSDIDRNTGAVIQAEPGSMLDKYKKEFIKSPSDKEMFEIIERHSAEVIRLVNHNREVKVMWHRHRGPAFVAAFIKHITEANYELPLKINGSSFDTMLEKMRVVLIKYGSTSLETDIDKYAKQIVQKIKTKIVDISVKKEVAL